MPVPPTSANLHHGNVLAIDDINESSVCRLLLEVVVPQQCGALSIKGARHPRILVSDALCGCQLIVSSMKAGRTYPDGHSDATRYINTALSETTPSSGAVVQLLLGGWCPRTHVQLGVRNIYTQVRVVL